MYARQPPDGRIPRHLQVPKNYSGNAFRPKEETEPETELTDQEPISSEEGSAKEANGEPSGDRSEESVPASLLRASPFSLGKLFGKSSRGGLGSEELLLLGVILLISQNEEKDDLLFLLILLLLL